MSAWDDPITHIRELEAEVSRLRNEKADALRADGDIRDYRGAYSRCVDLAEEWESATCITDGAPCSFHRYADDYARDLRDALEGR